MLNRTNWKPKKTTRYSQKELERLRARIEQIVQKCISNKGSVKVGLALQGGGAKGAFQYGVIRGLARLGIPVNCIAGSSVGALNGAIFATGDWDCGDRLWKSLDRDLIFKRRGIWYVLALLTLIGRFYYEYIRGIYSTDYPRVMLSFFFIIHHISLSLMLFAGGTVFSYTLYNESISPFLALIPILLTVLMIYGYAFSSPIEKAYTELVKAIIFFFALGAMFWDGLTNHGIWAYVAIAICLPSTPIMIAGLLSHHYNLALFSPGPLLETANSVCQSDLKIPLLATIAEEVEGYFDPDDYTHVRLTKNPIWEVCTRTVVAPIYTNLQEADDKAKLLINSAALPSGVVTFRKSDENRRLVDGGAADNTPWFPLVEQGCDVLIVVLCSKPSEEARVTRRKWQQKERFLRIIQSTRAVTPSLNQRPDPYTVKNSPPKAIPFSDETPRIPCVVTITPDYDTGGFLDGTMNFSAERARFNVSQGERIAEVLAGALAPLKIGSIDPQLEQEKSSPQAS